MARGLWVFAAFVLVGCSGSEPTVQARSGTDRLQDTAQKLIDDKDSSPEVRQFASGVVRETKNQQDVGAMLSGK